MCCQGKQFKKVIVLKVKTQKEERLSPKLKGKPHGRIKENGFGF